MAFRRIVGRGCLIGCLALLPTIVAPEPASADFDPPVKLSAPGQDARQPRTAIDADGDALIVWYRSDGTRFRVQARSLSSTGVLGPIQTLSKASVSAVDPELVIEAGGDALIVWSSNVLPARVQARTRAASGTLGPVKTLSAGQENVHPRIASDGAGNALVTWINGTGLENKRVQARVLLANGTLSAIRTVSDVGGIDTAGEVAVNANGNAFIAWTRRIGPNYRVQGLAVSSSGVLGPILTLSAAGQDAVAVQVAIDPAGNAVVVWHRGVSIDRVVQARKISAAGVLGPVKTVSSEFGQDPQVAMDNDGKALIVWQRLHDGYVHIQARSLSAAGALGTVKDLSATNGHAERADLAMNGSGKAVVVWERNDPVYDRIQAITRSGAGVFGPVKTISPVAQDAIEADVAINAGGNAAAAWELEDGSDDRIQATIGP